MTAARSLARRARAMTPAALVACLLASLLPGCGTLSGRSTLDLDARTRNAVGAEGEVALVRTPEQQAVTVAEAAAELASADVVFLGEQHDSAEGHAVQLALTEALADARGEIILSMEMFERDAQRRLDLYLAGAIDEEMFLEGARPWPNYAAHYRPAVEMARARGFEVVAANCYRPIASRVARRGLAEGAGDAWAARSVDVSKGEYRDRFDDVMSGGHGNSMPSAALDNIYAAQCIKDDTMAESIADAIDARGDDAPLVVHWNGRFHSDFGLGTVERLRKRKPDLNIAVVSMIATRNVQRALEGEELRQGHFVILVPPTSDE
ncbi:MAG: ChaN family lipoprotein [Planctomycetota bacterium]